MVLQAMYGDKSKTLSVMQSLSPVFVDVVKEYKDKLDKGEDPPPVKTYYIGALKPSLINDMVSNLNKRIRNMIYQIDLNYVYPKIEAFSQRSKKFLTECIDPDGKKFIKDLIKRLFVLVRIQSSHDDDDSQDDRSEDSSDFRKAIVAHVSLED